MTSGSHPLAAANKLESILLLRWVLIIATSYLVLFSRPLTRLPVAAPLFIAAYLSSNLGLRWLRSHLSESVFEITVVLLDTAMVALGLLMTGTASSEFFVVYFVVIFLSALTERAELVFAATALVSATYFYGMAQRTGVAPLLTSTYTLRIPLLLVVSLFFGRLVSQARARERAAEEDRSQELRMRFLSTFSHDLKNPLGTIQELANLLLEGEGGSLTQGQLALVRHIHASTRHLITFALNLIDAARIDAGRLSLHKQSTDVAGLIEDALLMARCASDLKGVTLRAHLPADLPRADIDPLQLERVIANLVGNAIKFTPAGGCVSLSAERAGDAMVIEVSDTGVGIEPHELRHVFDEYCHYSPNGSIDGSGLGLYIVKAIVEAHGGTVTLASTVGQGTTATVRLPLQATTKVASVVARRSTSPMMLPNLLSPAVFDMRK